MKTTLKIISLFFIVVIILVTYLSIVGIETTKFNNQINKKVENIDNNLSLDLKKVEIFLNPLKLNLRAKTLGTRIIKEDKNLKIENIKINISLKSLISGEFAIENVQISTKSIEISNLISFSRLIYQIPELIIFEKLFDIIGYIIANIKIEFDKDGRVKDNYIFSGFVKDTKANLSKDYRLTKLNLAYYITKENINLENLNVKLNNLDLESKKISAKKINSKYLVRGKIENDTAEFTDENFSFLKAKLFLDTDFKKIIFNSRNEFSFIIDKKLQLRETTISSKIMLQEAEIIKKIDLKEVFPEFNNEISFLNHEINLDYKKIFCR